MPLLHANFLLGILLAQALVRNLCYLEKIEDSRKSTNENLQTSDGKVPNEVEKAVPGMARLLIVLKQKIVESSHGPKNTAFRPAGSLNKSLVSPMARGQL